jgi:hypothetical protein
MPAWHIEKCKLRVKPKLYNIVKPKDFITKVHLGLPQPKVWFKDLVLEFGFSLFSAFQP